MTLIPFTDRDDIDDQQFVDALSQVDADRELAILIRRAIAKMCHPEPQEKLIRPMIRKSSRG